MELFLGLGLVGIVLAIIGFIVFMGIAILFIAYKSIKETAKEDPPKEQFQVEIKGENFFGNLEFIACINRIYYLEYVDTQGEITERKIRANSINKNKSGEYLIHAYCHLRKENRTFRVDRIHKILDAKKQPIKDPEKFFLLFKKDAA